jgi:hypothetical protein
MPLRGIFLAWLIGLTVFAAATIVSISRLSRRRLEVVPSSWSIASIVPDDALILPHSATPRGWNFRERYDENLFLRHQLDIALKRNSQLLILVNFPRPTLR